MARTARAVDGRRRPLSSVWHRAAPLQAFWLVGGVIENHPDCALTYLAGVLARVRLL
jgi:hypothetical protein